MSDSADIEAAAREEMRFLFELREHSGDEMAVALLAGDRETVDWLRAGRTWIDLRHAELVTVIVTFEDERRLTEMHLPRLGRRLHPVDA